MVVCDGLSLGTVLEDPLEDLIETVRFRKGPQDAFVLRFFF